MSSPEADFELDQYINRSVPQHVLDAGRVCLHLAGLGIKWVAKVAEASLTKPSNSSRPVDIFDLDH
jgi:hypothetical protein